jgi:hypothetical protein
VVLPEGRRAGAEDCPERTMNADQLNRYVMGAVCLLAGILYAGMVYAGFTEMVSRISKRSARGRRPKAGRTRRLPSAKKSA